MSQLLEVVGELIADLTWKRAGSALLVLVVLLCAFAMYESYTASFRLGRVDRAARILNNLVALEDNEGIKTDEALSEIHAKLVNRLGQLTDFSKPDSTVVSRLLRALTAFLPWFLLILAFGRRRGRGDKSAGSALGGTIVLAIPFVVGGVLLPQMHLGLINYIVYPWGSFLCFAVIALIASKATKRRRQET